MVALGDTPSSSRRSTCRSGCAPALGLWLLRAHGHRRVGLLDCSLLDDRGSFRDAADLTRTFTGVDLSGPTEVITYCTVGARAATAWFVLTHLLGRPGVRVYDGSWGEWGLDATSPVERTSARRETARLSGLTT